MRRQGNIIAFYTHHDYLSNHYAARFLLKDFEFPTAEAAIMFCKAKLFADEEAANAILATDNPQEQKMIGRAVQGYDDALWVQKRAGYYLQIVLAKYRFNPGLRAELVGTGDAILVEASARDTVWGAGLAESDDRIFDQSQWRGQNLCGFIQMQARTILYNDTHIVTP